MSHPIISVENLSKRYLIDRRADDDYSYYTALREVIGRELRGAASRVAGAVRGRLAPAENSYEEFWALKDVSFEVREGEVLGIIGRNGAGKSTLLKVLSRITEPTAGRVTLRGRVASLLEVGTGFHPELTGRENIYLNGAILGMSRAEIRKKFDEIVAFAEVERFLETPVKRYSSGMYVRLAFAVAAHLEPDILIVDEVLAVGDAEFQRKCLGKMDEASRREGRTVLFVSHNMAAVQTLCSRALLLRNSQLVGDGDVDLITKTHLTKDVNPGYENNKKITKQLNESIKLELEIDEQIMRSGSNLKYNIRLLSNSHTSVREIALLIHSIAGARLAIADLRCPNGPYQLYPGHPLQIEGEILKLELVDGQYYLGVGLNCGACQASIEYLLEINITDIGRNDGLSQYRARDRGVINLAHTFCVPSDGVMNKYEINVKS